MKLAFSTLPCATWSLAHTLQICSDSKMDGIEIRLGLNDWSNPDMSDEQRQALITGLQEHHLTVSDLGTSVVIRGYDAEQMRNIIQCIALAKAVQAKGLRIMLGNFIVRFSDEVPAIDYDGIVQWLKEACALAHKDGVQIWIETHNEFASGKSLRALLDVVGAPNLKILWDVIHPLEVGESLEESLAYMGQDIAHVHVKDGKPWPDKDMANWEYTRMGEGQIPLAAFVALLKQHGYDGFYSLEWESAWRPEIRGEGFEGEVVIPHFANFMRNLEAENLNAANLKSEGAAQ